MATSKSTRSARVHSPRLAPPRVPGTAANGSDGGAPPCSITQLRRLRLLLPRLRAIYGMAVTAELALRQQAAEQDPEVADCLRAGVCDPIASQLQEVEDLIVEFRNAGDDSRP